MHIESGPTRERIVRSLLMLCMVTAFSIWFAYDGYVGYLKDNFEEHLKQLETKQRVAAADAKVYPLVKVGAVAKAKEALRKFNKASQMAALEEAFGGPPSVETEDAWYYYGPAFRIKIALDEGRPISAGGAVSTHSATDIVGQKYFALALGAFALILVINFIRILRTHLVLDDAGLTYRTSKPIRWEEMKSLDTEQFDKKGWVDLVYDEDDKERYVRLDEYHLALFDEVIDTLCERKGFENPLPVDRAGTAGEEQAASEVEHESDSASPTPDA